VPLERYRENLIAIARDSEASGIKVIFVTAPTNHVAGQEPAYLQARHLKNLPLLVPLHRSYVQATRDAAHATGAWLCDAAQAAEQAGAGRQAWFRHDGIHFTADGDRAMAAIVSDCIARVAP
jgi:lysophospholipase L1-like esterase